MAHNRTRAQKDEERKLVLATKLSFYKAWHFSAFCPRCYDYRKVEIRPLLAHRSPTETVAETISKLRCHKHHMAPDRITLEGKCLHIYLKGLY
ncbi:hypothetical protein GHA01_24310 [Novacetimonas hansenii]|uniref:Transposase n=1 Tax=Novacetimonas hansenii TaxID=436 RepID=A0ABQ0SGW8_NOVHA|nr:hypothetical protein Gaha_0122_002 [Novacetimonas hansenii JCM 7643]GEC64582.1 hypothetical protein GHA01_24310 [Novacetimonas hansenii]